MADLNQIRAGLARALEGIPGLRVSQYVRGAIEPPMAEIGFPSEIDYELTFSHAKDQYTIPVRVYVGTADNEAASTLLGEFLAQTGDRSVKTVLEVDRTLEGIVDDLDVRRVSGAGVVEKGGIEYLAADWEVWIVG